VSADQGRSRSPEERARRAVAVRALLDDPNVQEAFRSIEADLTAEWKRARTTEERENIWRAVNVIERLQAWLRSAASHDLAALRRAK
jgi:hypothetical protein